MALLPLSTHVSSPHLLHMRSLREHSCQAGVSEGCSFWGRKEGKDHRRQTNQGSDLRTGRRVRAPGSQRDHALGDLEFSEAEVTVGCPLQRCVTF